MRYVHGPERQIIEQQIAKLVAEKAKAKAVQPAGMNPRSRALPGYVPPEQVRGLPANANQDVGNVNPRSRALPGYVPPEQLDLSYLTGNRPSSSGLNPEGTAPSYQDQSMRPHLDSGPESPVGTNPNTTDPMMGNWNPMMGSDETAGQPSMMDKIMGYKPDMGMQQLFEAAGKAYGNPLIGVAPSAGGTSIGNEYSNLNATYADKRKTKLANDKLKQLEMDKKSAAADKRVVQNEQLKSLLDDGAINLQQYKRVLALPGDKQNLIDQLSERQKLTLGGKKQTEGQRTKEQRFKTARASLDVMKRIVGDPDFNPTGFLNSLASNETGKDVLNILDASAKAMGFDGIDGMPKINKYQAAAGSWLIQILRDDSGAAVPETENARYKSVYLPRIGESDDVVKSKLARMENITNNLASAAGLSDEEKMKIPGVSNKVALILEDPKNRSLSEKDVLDLAVKMKVLDDEAGSGVNKTLSFDSEGNLLENNK